MMGPFVPDLVSNELNLVVALLLGIAFGFVLERAGFGSSRRLAGVFYGYDFTVLRVFFTAAVTAMSGVLLLGASGLLDTDVIYVNPTWLWPAIVGGAIMGVGFILGGYCPGTGVCAAATGKIDGMFFVGGGLLGVLAFAEFFPAWGRFYESSFLGPVKVFESLGVSQNLFAFLLVAAAVLAFTAATAVERRVAGPAAPSAAFPVGKHLAAGGATLLLGLLLLATPDRKARLLAAVSEPAYAAAHPVAMMDADELAFRIVDGDPRLQVIDLRTPQAYARFALPASKNVQMAEVFGREPVEALARPHVRKVLVGDSEHDERVACLLLARLGYENLAALKGGLGAFRDTILSPPSDTPAPSGNGEVRAFRQAARTRILELTARARTAGPKEAKKVKIQGGC